MKYKNGRVLGMNNALQELAKFGVKDERVGLKLTRILIFIQDKAEAVLTARDLLLKSFAKEDANGRPEVIGEGHEQEVVFENKVEAEAEIGSFLRAEDVDFGDTLPKPLTYAELITKFKKVPDPGLIAALGPFAELPAED